MNISVKNKVILTAIGVFFLFVSIAFLPRDIKEYEIKQKGEIVEITILSMPSNCRSTKWHPKVSFIYKDKVYSKGTGWGICDKQVGDKFLMKHLDKYENIFVYPKEHFTYRFLSTIGLLLLGLYTLVYAHASQMLPYWLKGEKKEYTPKRLTSEEMLKRHLAHRENSPRKKKKDK